jgi:copper chaperone CopZ
VKTEYKITGMSCQHCVGAVKTALEKIPGVTRAEVTVGAATLEASRALTRDEVDKALDDEGFRLAN